MVSFLRRASAFCAASRLNNRLCATRTLRPAMLAVAVLATSILTAAQVRAQTGACCFPASADQDCYDDGDVGKCDGVGGVYSDGQKCADPGSCDCVEPCANSVTLGANNGSDLRITLASVTNVGDVNGDTFDDTKFTYHLCQPSGSAHDTSHFVIGVPTLEALWPSMTFKQQTPITK